MTERGPKIWDVSVEDVEYRDGVLQHKSDPELRLTFRQLAARQNATGGPITGRAGINPAGAGSTIATHIVDVDPETGKVTILRYTALQDAGKAICPSYVESQMQGGAVQGIGWALNEEYFYTELQLPGLPDAHQPGPSNDRHRNRRGRQPEPSIWGARCRGGAPRSPMATLANAIYDALGVRMNQLPMNPGRILEALWEEK